MSHALIRDNISTVYSTFFRQTYNYELNQDNNNHNLFYVSSPRIAIKPKIGFMRHGYFYYEHKNLVRLTRGIDRTHGLSLVNEASNSNKALFYGIQRAKVDYVGPLSSRRNNVMITTPPLFKNSISDISSSYLSNITTFHMYSTNGPRYIMESLYLSFDSKHSPLYFMIDKFSLYSSSPIPPLPNTYPVFLYWW